MNSKQFAKVSVYPPIHVKSIKQIKKTRENDLEIQNLMFFLEIMDTSFSTEETTEHH